MGKTRHTFNKTTVLRDLRLVFLSDEAGSILSRIDLIELKKWKEKNELPKCIVQKVFLAIC